MHFSSCYRSVSLGLLAKSDARVVNSRIFLSIQIKAQLWINSTEKKTSKLQNYKIIGHKDAEEKLPVMSERDAEP
jgi:hypothetical protein